MNRRTFTKLISFSALFPSILKPHSRRHNPAKDFTHLYYKRKGVIFEREGRYYVSIYPDPRDKGAYLSLKNPIKWFDVTESIG